jgi:hypothetical protein
LLSDPKPIFVSPIRLIILLPLSEQPLVMQDLVADPVHAGDDGGVGISDVDRRHVGHRLHHVRRHDDAGFTCKDAVHCFTLVSPFLD